MSDIHNSSRLANSNYYYYYIKNIAVNVNGLLQHPKKSCKRASLHIIIINVYDNITIIAKRQTYRMTTSAPCLHRDGVTRCWNSAVSRTVRGKCCAGGADHHPPHLSDQSRCPLLHAGSQNVNTVRQSDARWTTSGDDDGARRVLSVESPHGLGLSTPGETEPSVNYRCTRPCKGRTATTTTTDSDWKTMPMIMATELYYTRL